LDLAVQNVEGAVHGAMVVGVLLAAENARRVGYLDTIGAAVLVLALFWLVGIYAHDLGERLQRRELVNLRQVWHSCVHELTIVEGGFIPVLALLVAWAIGVRVTDGVRVAVWTAAAGVIVLEVAAAWRARLRPKRFWLQACTGAAIGLAIVALNLILH
jgi:hypothetical protein